MVRIKIYMEIDLKHAKPTMGVCLRAEITETKLVVDSRFVRHKQFSEEAEIIEKDESNLHFLVR
jgi:hypothetical protein